MGAPATATRRRRAAASQAPVSQPPDQVTVAAQPVTPPDQGTFTAAVTATGLVVLDYDLSTYMAKSSDGKRWHLIGPATEGSWVVQQGWRQAGQLTCNCIGGRTRGTCYRVAQAEAYETRMADDAAWAAMWSTTASESPAVRS